MTKFTEFFASVWKVIIKGDMERVPGYIAVGGLSWVDGYCESQPVGAANQGNTQVLLFLLWIGIGVYYDDVITKEATFLSLQNMFGHYSSHP